MKLYVAYGSNLNMKQMKKRCPDAIPIGSGFMNNWKLVYRGSKTGAYATVIRKHGSMVPIGLWKISALDEYRQDAKPGIPSSIYIDVCRSGYHDFGLNEDYLNESLSS